MFAKKSSSTKNPLAQGGNKILVLAITALLVALIFLIFYSLQLFINSEKILQKNLIFNDTADINNDFSAWRLQRLAVPMIINLPLAEITEANIFISPSHLVAWLNQNFQLTDENRYTAQSFEDFLATKQGNMVDWAVFSNSILQQIVFSSGILRYDYLATTTYEVNPDKTLTLTTTNRDTANSLIVNKEITRTDSLTSNFIVVYRDGDFPQYLAFTSEGALLFNYGESFEHILAAEEERLGIKIKRYLYFPVGSNDLSTPINNFNWIIFN